MVTDNVKAVAADGATTLILKEDGSVYGAGYNVGNALLQGSSADVTTGFKLVTTGAKKIEYGNYHSMIIKTDNTLYIAGTDFTGLELIDTNVKSVNGSHNTGSVYVKFDGRVYGFGANTYGRFGLNHTNTIAEPTLVF